MKKTWELLALLLAMCLVSLSMFACGDKTGDGGEGGETPDGGQTEETPGGGEDGGEDAENDNRVPISDLLEGLE